MEQQTFEGTWSEILLRASELAGRRVRLTILTNETSSDPSTDTLDKSLQGRVGKVNFQPSNLSERTREAFADILSAKYDPSRLNQ
ncbi:MAG: hypothetical protein V7L00_05530 [Nostoc sp.]|uniref:hypothetical protein n=1 Tax=Nostoc sp. TaxID=1180 RepID=UPI002FF68E3F